VSQETVPQPTSPPEAPDPARPGLQGRTRKCQERQGIVWALGKPRNNSPDRPSHIEMPRPVTLLVG